MHVQIPPHVIQEHLDFRQKVAAFQAGELSEADFKPYRASMGIYEQRQDGQFMLRPRIPSGAITPAQFRGIARIARQQGLDSIHLTTRQDIQFHGLRLASIPDMLEQLLELDLDSKGTGGNTARNIAVSPLSGVSLDDVFDVLPYAIAGANHLILDPANYRLPRKYKISFSNSREDTAAATLADLGFIAKLQNGEQGFAVFGGGGLGGSPNPAMMLADFCPASDVLVYIEAMKRLFEREGDRTNRNKARIRFILKRLGETAFRELFLAHVREVQASENLSVTLNTHPKVTPTVTVITEQSAGAAMATSQNPHALPPDPRLIPQKQPGLFAVYLHPVNGNLALDNLETVLDFAEQLPEPVSIRLDTAQGFYLRDLPLAAAKTLLDLTQSWAFPQPLFHSVACTGASTCRLGICQSQALLTKILDRFVHEPADLAWQLPQLFISGCPNSCGQHQKGLIGLTGRTKKIDGAVQPYYAISLGGRVSLDDTHFGQVIGELPEANIPDFLVAVSQLHQQTALPYTAFISQQHSEISQFLTSSN